MSGLVALGASCGFTPVPEPPALDPPDLEQVTLVVDSILPPTPETPFDIAGDVGAAEPGTTIWIVNLDLPYPPWESVVGEDGSFLVSVLGEEGQELRIQLRQDDLRSDPLDVIIENIVNGARVSLADREGCITAAAELDLGDAPVSETTTGSIVVANHCADDLVIERVESRRAMPDLAATPTLPLTIAPGTSSQIDIRFAPSEEGTFEEILFIFITSPVTERRSVTVFGRVVNE